MGVCDIWFVITDDHTLSSVRRSEMVRTSYVEGVLKVSETCQNIEQSSVEPHMSGNTPGRGASLALHTATTTDKHTKVIPGIFFKALCVNMVDSVACCMTLINHRTLGGENKQLALGLV